MEDGQVCVGQRWAPAALRTKFEQIRSQKNGIMYENYEIVLARAPSAVAPVAPRFQGYTAPLPPATNGAHSNWKSHTARMGKVPNWYFEQAHRLPNCSLPTKSSEFCFARSDKKQ